MDGPSLDVSAGVGGEEIRALLHHGWLGVSRGGIEGEITWSGVVNVNGGGLVTCTDEGLDGAHHTVLGVGLDLHGGPVGSDPELNESLDGAAGGVNADLDDFLVGVGELPVLTGGTLNADRAADCAEVPFAGDTVEGGGLGNRDGLVD